MGANFNNIINKDKHSLNEKNQLFIKKKKKEKNFLFSKETEIKELV